MLRSPFASAGLLRLRMPAELAVAHAYGPLVSDERSEDLFHLAGCDADTSVAFAFRFTKSDGWGSSPEVHASAHHGAGWGSSPEAKPAVQLAYSYSILVPAPAERDEGEDAEDARGGADDARDGAEDEGEDGDSEADDDECRDRQIHRDRQILVRRLRVHTVRLGIARNLRELYESIDSSAMLGLLAHKVISAIEHQGSREGRLLLQVRPWPLMTAQDCSGLFRTASCHGMATECCPPPRLAALCLVWQHCACCLPLSDPRSFPYSGRIGWCSCSAASSSLDLPLSSLDLACTLGSPTMHSIRPSYHDRCSPCRAGYMLSCKGRCSLHTSLHTSLQKRPSRAVRPSRRSRRMSARGCMHSTGGFRRQTCASRSCPRSPATLQMPN